MKRKNQKTLSLIIFFISWIPFVFGTLHAYYGYWNEYDYIEFDHQFTCENKTFSRRLDSGHKYKINIVIRGGFQEEIEGTFEIFLDDKTIKKIHLYDGENSIDESDGESYTTETKKKTLLEIKNLKCSADSWEVEVYKNLPGYLYIIGGVAMICFILGLTGIIMGPFLYIILSWKARYEPS